MRTVHGLLLLLLIPLALPARSQDDRPEPEDPQSTPAPEQPVTQQPRGGLLGILGGPPMQMGTTPLRLDGDIDGQDGVDSELQLKYEDFRIIFEAGQRVRISATSFAMDPRLRVFAPGRTEPLADDEDSGRGANARLTLTLSEPGTYIVRVLGSHRGLNGPYRLTVEPAPPLPDPVAADGAAPSETTRWSQFNGELTTQDVSVEGLYFDDYRVTLTANQEVFLRLDSTDFDPVVQVYDAAEREGDYLAMDDDSGPGRNSLLLFRSPEAGEYVIRVTTFSDRLPTGQYALRIGR